MIPALISVVTVGARDIPAMCAFYRALGWEPAVEMDDFVAFETRGAVFTLYDADKLAADANATDVAPPDAFPGFNLAINVERREQVDEVIASAERAGARVAAAPEDRDWGGRSGYFADPEGNHWEVAWVPPDSTTAALVAKAIGP